MIPNSTPPSGCIRTERTYTSCCPYSRPQSQTSSKASEVRLTAHTPPECLTIKDKKVKDLSTEIGKLLKEGMEAWRQGEEKKADQMLKVAMRLTLVDPKQMTSKIRLNIANTFLQLGNLEKYCLYFKIAFLKDPAFFSISAYLDSLYELYREEEAIEFINKNVVQHKDSIAYVEALQFLEDIREPEMGAAPRSY